MAGKSCICVQTGTRNPLVPPWKKFQRVSIIPANSSQFRSVYFLGETELTATIQLASSSPTSPTNSPPAPPSSSPAGNGPNTSPSPSSIRHPSASPPTLCVFPFFFFFFFFFVFSAEALSLTLYLSFSLLFFLSVLV
jgi:hypothetical protein